MLKQIVSGAVILLLAGCFGTNYHWDAATEARQTAAKAQSGDLVAQYDIALAIGTGTGVQKDEVKALAILEKIASQDAKAVSGKEKLVIRLAQTKMGVAYHYGVGEDVDDRKALQYLEQATEDGLLDPLLGEAYVILGWIHAASIENDLRDPKKAYECAALVKHLNFPEVKILLANLYEYGIGVQKDYGKSLQLYREALNAGYKNATGGIIDAYLFGHGLSVDYGKVKSLSNEMIAKGENYYKIRLAYLAYKGLGEKKDTEKARTLIMEAMQDTPIDNVYKSGMSIKYGLCEVPDKGFGNLVLSDACRRGNQKACSEMKK